MSTIPRRLSLPPPPGGGHYRHRQPEERPPGRLRIGIVEYRHADRVTADCDHRDTTATSQPGSPAGPGRRLRRLPAVMWGAARIITSFTNLKDFLASAGKSGY